MTRPSTRIVYFCRWLLIGMAGAVWCAGLSGTLAQYFHLPFFLGTAGTLFCSFTGGLVSILITLLCKYKGAELIDVLPHFLPLYLPIVDIISVNHQPWRGPVVLVVSLFLVFLGKVKLSRGLGFGFAVLVPLLLYLPDISPYVGRADTFEFQVVAPNLGIAHPSGYPLYTIIGKIFSFVPYGSTAWRINLSSSVLASLASGVLYLALTEIALLIANDLKPEYTTTMALLTALTMAFTPTLWSRAIEAEVYSLNACIVALMIWLACLWYGNKLHGKIILPLCGMLTGLALASHITLGALVSIVVIAMIYKRDEIGLGTILLSLGLGLAGISLYLYIPLRWPAVTGGEMIPLSDFIRYVTNAESGGALLPCAFIKDPSRWELVFRLVRQQIGWIGILVSATGLTILIIQKWPLAVGSLLSFSAWIWFGLSFYVAEPDYSAFLIPGHVVILFWLGVGTLSALRFLKQHIPGLMTLGLIAFALLPSSRLWITGPQLNTIGLGYADEMWGRYVLRLPIEENAVILADSVKFPPLYYLQQVEGIRPDVRSITLFNETQYRNAVVENISQKKTVYLARYLPGMDEFGINSLGPLVRVAPVEDSADDGTTGIEFGDLLKLGSFSLVPDPLGRPMHHLTLHWFPIDNIDKDLEVRIRLSTQTGHMAWTNHPARPVGGYSSTTAWLKGTAIDDYYALLWPDWLPTDNYNLEIGVFPRFSDDGLLVNDRAVNWVILTTQAFGTSNGNVLDPGHAMIPKQALFGNDFWLVGVDIPSEVTISSTMKVDLTVVCGNQDTPSMVPQFFWVNEDGKRYTPEIVYEQSTGAKTTGNLQCNRQKEVRRFNILTPVIAGNYVLELEMINEQEDAFPARCQWLDRIGTFCPVAEISVTPSNAGIANYNHTMLLLNAEMDAEGIPAGGPLSVSLLWRGLRSMKNDYTMFLQIIGPDGKIYGQVDTWPQHGGRPTSGWLVSEEINDQYNIYLGENTPPGEYSVILGWYLLADMTRIPLVSETGQIVNDFYQLGSFQLPSVDSID